MKINKRIAKQHASCMIVIYGKGRILSAFTVSIKVLMDVSGIDANCYGLGFNETCDGSEDDMFPRRRDRLSLFPLRLTHNIL